MVEDHAKAIELKPCPFCGAEAMIETRQDEDLWSHNIVTWTGVRCPECELVFDWPPGADPDAATRWNTRAVSISRASQGSEAEAIAAWAKAICPECGGPLGNAHDGVCEICFGKRCGALSPPATPQAPCSDDDKGAWIIWFEDTEVTPELFFGCGARNAAAARFEQMKIGYNCHLFQKVATPQAPEDVRAKAVAAIDDARAYAFGFPSSEYVVGALDRANLLATPVTVTMEECKAVVADWVRDQMGEHRRAGNPEQALAGALRRVLGDRVQISGQGGEKS